MGQPNLNTSDAKIPHGTLCVCLVILKFRLGRILDEFLWVVTNFNSVKGTLETPIGSTGTEFGAVCLTLVGISKRKDFVKMLFGTQ